MKIHIIGCSGTGKTYLAKKLSNKYNIPHYDLDNIYWDNSSQKYGIKTEVEKRDKLLLNILEKDDWIIEGIYYKWLEQSFKNADIIYILDLPKYIYKFRIIKRFVKRKLKLEISKKETLKSLLDLLKWTDKFQNENMKEIVKFLEIYKEKVYFIKKKLKKFLKGSYFKLPFSIKTNPNVSLFLKVLIQEHCLQSYKQVTNQVLYGTL